MNEIWREHLLVLWLELPLIWKNKTLKKKDKFLEHRASKMEKKTDSSLNGLSLNERFKEVSTEMFQVLATELFTQIHTYVCTEQVKLQ